MGSGSGFGGPSGDQDIRWLSSPIWDNYNNGLGNPGPRYYLTNPEKPAKSTGKSAKNLSLKKTQIVGGNEENS